MYDWTVKYDILLTVIFYFFTKKKCVNRKRLVTCWIDRIWETRVYQMTPCLWYSRSWCLYNVWIDQGSSLSTLLEGKLYSRLSLSAWESQVENRLVNATVCLCNRESNSQYSRTSRNWPPCDRAQVGKHFVFINQILWKLHNSNWIHVVNGQILFKVAFFPSI